MSDIDPELPDYLIDAILSEQAPTEAIDLVKNALTWRTVDSELMELSYDSMLDEAGVRDASMRRSMEFSLDNLSLVVEIDGLRIEGSLSVDIDGQVSLLDQGKEAVQSAIIDGRFSVQANRAGVTRLRLDVGDRSIAVPVFVVR